MKPFKKLIILLSLAIFIASIGQASEQRKQPLEEILRAEQIKPYDVPIYEQSREWLLREFGPGDPYPINLTLATKNIVWQARQEIQAGELDPIQGIIRTFWYTNIKPVFARTGSLNEDVEQSDVLHNVLVELVRTRDIMRYKDMGFLNNNAGTLKIDKNWQSY
ncbi:MAG: hypothetical protein B6I30_10165 [Desulfobacteraceae bacterium 4572_187]|nr:MAG: hypothetical protein B6I30_10165 [Desulfobacteraceae bacterium 4572_187]